MGEANLDILESNVKHNTEDLRELKKRITRAEEEVSDLKANQQVMNQTVGHLMTTLEELKDDFKAVSTKIDENQIEQLREYKNSVWKIGVMVSGAVITATLLFLLGI